MIDLDKWITWIQGYPTWLQVTITVWAGLTFLVFALLLFTPRISPPPKIDSSSTPPTIPPSDSAPGQSAQPPAGNTRNISRPGQASTSTGSAPAETVIPPGFTIRNSERNVFRKNKFGGVGVEIDKARDDKWEENTFIEKSQ